MSKTDCRGVFKKYCCVTAFQLLLHVFLTAQSSSVRSLSQNCLKYEWTSSIWNYESVLQHTRHSSFDISELAKNYFSWIYVPCTSFDFTMELLRCCQGSLPSRCVGHCRGCPPSCLGEDGARPKEGCPRSRTPSNVHPDSHSKHWK